MGSQRSSAAAATVRPPDVPDELRDVDLDDDLELGDDQRLEEVRLSGSWMQSTVDGLEIVGSVLAGVRWTGSTFENLGLRDVRLVDCELSGATLTGASLERVAFLRCRMSGVVASDVRAKDVVFGDCVMDEAWLRMATFERCELSGCDLRSADFYGATLKDTRLVHSVLDDTEWAEAKTDNVALHGSSLGAVRDVEALRNVVVGSDQVMSLALPILAAHGIVVDDDYLDGTG